MKVKGEDYCWDGKKEYIQRRERSVFELLFIQSSKYIFLESLFKETRHAAG
jgi:hypothetical protein